MRKSERILSHTGTTNVYDLSEGDPSIEKGKEGTSLFYPFVPTVMLC